MLRVSVIIPNYNHARFLTARLESVFSQTYQDFEVIILDDGSSDDSHQVIAPYLTDARVRFYPNEVNSGSPFIQWNRGVSLSRGEFVWIAESDDVADPELLSTLVTHLQENPQVGLSYCQSRLIDEAGLEIAPTASWVDKLDPIRWRTGFINKGVDECADYLLWMNTIPNASAVVFRRSVFEAIGGAPLNLRLCGDWMTWVKMLMKSWVCFEPQPLNSFRCHPQTVRTETSEKHFNLERWQVQSFIVRHSHINKAAKHELLKRIVAALFDKDSATRILKRELFKFLAAVWPIIVRSPFFTASVFFRSLFSKIIKTDVTRTLVNPSETTTAK